MRDVALTSFYKDRLESMTEQYNRFYFAYGSNMDRAQMSQKCSGAVFVGIAKLAGHRFIINKGIH